MAPTERKTIRFRGRTEPVIESFHVRGRSYFALEKLSGRGVLLMRTFMDEVSFNERGNEVTMVKRRQASAS